jgi:glycosyltransferase involved in cell wall biosynthesis
VIPTRGRPQLVVRSLQSVLRQTYSSLEVIVVIDGPDPETLKALQEIRDSRLRAIALPDAVGGSEARNIGVREAHGEWIAFLDDDDEWMPVKIARQMRKALRLRDSVPILSSRFVATTPSTSFQLPRMLYRSGEQVGDYLFCREGLAKSGGILQTSTLLVPRDLLLRVPFRTGLKMHQDWDWILRAAAHKNVRIQMLSEPLAICRIEDERSSVGRVPDWRFSLEWVRGMREYLSPQPYSWFIAVQCVWRAVQSGAALAEKWMLARAFFLEGRPTWKAGAHFAVFACVPVALRKGIRNRVWPLSEWLGRARRLKIASELQDSTT